MPRLQQKPNVMLICQDCRFRPVIGNMVWELVTAPVTIAVLIKKNPRRFISSGIFFGGVILSAWADRVIFRLARA